MGSDGQRYSDSSQRRSLGSSYSNSTVLEAIDEQLTGGLPKHAGSMASSRISNDTAKARCSGESKASPTYISYARLSRPESHQGIYTLDIL